MNSTSDPGPVVEALGHVAYHFYKIKPLLPTYIHLLISAIFPIITASHASLARPTSAKPVRKRKLQDHEDDKSDDSENEEKSPKIETITASDAFLFPLLAGATLGTLYLIIKWLEDPALLNKILGFYFSWVGIFFTFKFTKDILSFFRSVMFPTLYSSSGLLWKAPATAELFTAVDTSGAIISRNSPLPGTSGRLPLPTLIAGPLWNLRCQVYKRAVLKISIPRKLGPISKTKTKLRFDPYLDIGAGLVSLSILIYQSLPNAKTAEGITRSPSWVLTNLLGFSFCHGSLQFITPGTFPVGTLLLCLLFLYDIYMVFYTPMMVTVATKLDVPIKLLFPKPVEGCPFPIGAEKGSERMEEYLRCLAKKRTMAMLGLGDIVIPGMMIALALRFDLWKHYKALATTKIADVQQDEKNKDTVGSVDDRPQYHPVRGSWGERLYISRVHIRNHADCQGVKAKLFRKDYFYASIFGYVIGMIATVLVMQVFQHAQPALLYLVPGVLTALWGTAVVKGDMKMLWAYDENEDEKESTKSESKSKEEGAKDGDDSTSTKEEPQDTQTKKTDENKTSAVTATRTEESKAILEPFGWKNLALNYHSPIDFSISVPSRLTLSVKPITPKLKEDAVSHMNGTTIHGGAGSEQVDDTRTSSGQKGTSDDYSASSAFKTREAKLSTNATFTTSTERDAEPPGKRRRKI